MNCVVAVCCICYAGDVAGILCGVGGEGVLGELLPYITGRIQGNLERESGELDPQLTQNWATQT